MDPTFSALIALLPPHWVPYVYGAFAFVGMLSALLATAKPLLAKLPMQWRYWVDGAVHILDAIALNTKGMVHRPFPEEKRRSTPPGKP
jgi:hypothetical protein